jgi:hypothetical protein
MAYIGRGTENISNVEVLDNLTFNGSASYTLQKSSTNFVPSSANNLLISISGVVQQGNFTVSGSTITFDTTVASSDTCDWILHYGTGLITTVADGAITEAKLGSSAVTTAKINDGAITSAKLDSGLALGKIGQVVQATDTTSASQGTSAGVFYGVGAGVQITPTSTSSKIIVMPSLSIGNNADGRSITRLVRTIGATSTNLLVNTSGSNINGTFGGLYDSDGNVLRTVNFCFVDSPNTTSQCTYTTQIGCNTSSTLYINRSATNNVHGSSAMVCMEVLA